MKKTINVNIGSFGFIIDEDAYMLLKQYLKNIRIRLNPAEADEIVADIESRIADIFKENLSFGNQVVTAELVRRAIGIIGHAEDFGEPKVNPSKVHDDDTKRLFRSRSERVIAGVCGGVAEYLKLDATLVRVIAFILLIFGGMSLWVYIIMWIIVPQQPIHSNYYNTNER